MAPILWQVPRQMSADAGAAIYVTVEHRHTNMSCRTGEPLVGSHCDQQHKQMDETFGVSQLNFEGTKLLVPAETKHSDQLRAGFLLAGCCLWHFTTLTPALASPCACVPPKNRLSQQQSTRLSSGRLTQ